MKLIVAVAIKETIVAVDMAAVGRVMPVLVLRGC